MFSSDDAVQSYTINAVNSFLAQRKNPNGCTPKMTYYTQINYTNFTLVTDWFVAGNEIADHTSVTLFISLVKSDCTSETYLHLVSRMTHIVQAGTDEINGNLIALNALAGIPFKDLVGFRAPYLNITAAMLQDLANAGFLYDSTLTSSLPLNVNGTDAYWPYTLDNGLANSCLTFDDICKGKPKIPGFWEVPMYAIFDEHGVDGIHLMDPWLDGNTSEVLTWLKNNFAAPCE